MTSRITLLLFASLLLTGSLVGAATVPTPDTSTAPTPAVVTPAVSHDGACGDGSSAALAIFAPDPKNQGASDYDYCGMCGKDPCRGVLRGTICGFDYGAGRYKRCEMLYGDECPAENRLICYCYSGDIP
jgi:hypothetical protein